MATLMDSLTNVNLKEAQTFIQALAGPSAAVTFQTFDDRSYGRPQLRRILHGSLPEHGNLLGKLNSEGAGVFLMVNAGDLVGRKLENVVAVRALFLDLDSAPVSAVEEAGADPDIVVETSPGRWHVYWRVEDCQLESFPTIQKELARKFGGDPKVCDLPRVMRLPGFLHQKSDQAFCVKLLKVADRPIRKLQDLSDLLGISLGQKDRSERKSFCSLQSSSVCTALPEKFGERNESLFVYARRMKAEYPDASLEQRRQMVGIWYQQAAAQIRTKDIGVSYADFERAWAGVRSPHGTVLKEVLADLQEPPMDLATLGYGVNGQHLLKVMFTLKCHQDRHHSGAAIIMGARKAAEILGIDKTDANKLLRSLVDNGVLELIERGAGNRASRWRWVWRSDGEVKRGISLCGSESPETYDSDT